MTDAVLLAHAMFYVYASTPSATTNLFKPHQDVISMFGDGLCAAAPNEVWGRQRNYKIDGASATGMFHTKPGRDSRSGTKGVLGGRATNARIWLGRPAHVVRCFDDPITF
jgi:hypothetical protein